MPRDMSLPDLPPVESVPGQLPLFEEKAALDALVEFCHEEPDGEYLGRFFSIDYSAVDGAWEVCVFLGPGYTSDGVRVVRRDGSADRWMRTSGESFEDAVSLAAAKLPSVRRLKSR